MENYAAPKTESDCVKKIYSVRKCFKQDVREKNERFVSESEARETDSENEAEKCYVCGHFWPQDCDLVVFVKWAQCSFKNCDYWTNLQVFFQQK